MIIDRSEYYCFPGEQLNDVNLITSIDSTLEWKTTYVLVNHTGNLSTTAITKCGREIQYQEGSINIVDPYISYEKVIVPRGLKLIVINNDKQHILYYGTYIFGDSNYQLAGITDIKSITIDHVTSSQNIDHLGYGTYLMNTIIDNPNYIYDIRSQTSTLNIIPKVDLELDHDSLVCEYGEQVKPRLIKYPLEIDVLDTTKLDVGTYQTMLIALCNGIKVKFNAELVVVPKTLIVDWWTWKNTILNNYNIYGAEYVVTFDTPTNMQEQLIDQMPTLFTIGLNHMLSCKLVIPQYPSSNRYYQVKTIALENSTVTNRYHIKYSSCMDYNHSNGTVDHIYFEPRLFVKPRISHVDKPSIIIKSLSKLFSIVSKGHGVTEIRNKSRRRRNGIKTIYFTVDKELVSHHLVGTIDDDVPISIVFKILSDQISGGEQEYRVDSGTISSVSRTQFVIRLRKSYRITKKNMIILRISDMIIKQGESVETRSTGILKYPRPGKNIHKYT